YAVHPDIGNTAVGCKINGQIAPLTSELVNGDEVEIATSKAQSAPPAAWESLAVTGKARAAIRRATRAAVRKQYAGLGREIVERLIVRAGKPYSEKEVTAAIPRVGHKNLEDALAAVGRGELAAADIVRAMGLPVEDGKAKGSPRVSTLQNPNDPKAIPVRGVNRDLPLTISPQTGAVPGERIVGIMTPGQGITIYPIFAKALEEFDS